MGINATLSLGEYLNKTNTFIVPYYQRGYIWGKIGSGEDSATYLMNTILTYYNQEKKELFLHGITAAQEEDKLILIDGQQRTTFFYLLLAYLEEKPRFTIAYEIRKESDEFLKSIKNKSRNDLVEAASENTGENHQDIFFFKKTIRIIDSALKEKTLEELNVLRDYVLESLKFLYIEIPAEKQTLVFSMMNGNKAVMTDEELIKAELLRLISAETIQSQAQEWETVLLRSKYTREWDRWLYWWNKPEIKQFYKTNNNAALGILLKTYYTIHTKPNSQYSFTAFRDACLKAKNTIEIKAVFYELRCLQKKFEDVHNSISQEDNSLHNKIGAIITIFNKSDRETFITEYFSGSISDEKLGEIYKYIFLNTQYKEIKEYLNQKNSNAKDSEETLEDKIEEIIKALSSNDVYNHNDYKEYAYLQLLRLNIEEDTKLDRAFDFSCWDNNKKSLEHIYPQSKVITAENTHYIQDTQNKEAINRADFNGNGSEHCIGNLVLLHKNENSQFGNKSFEEKKNMYFDTATGFKSRHLLHSISVFAKTSWGITEIQNNKEKIVQEIKRYYDYRK